MMARALLTFALTAITVGASAADVPVLGHTPQLVLRDAAAKSAMALAVTSPSFRQGEDIPYDYTQYGRNRFPGLAWSRGPDGTQSYLVVVQGEGEHAGAMTSIHLTLYNLPASTQGLPVGMTDAPEGSTYGPNVHGVSAAYAGPHTHTLAKHAYHFQVLALDTRLPVAADQSFDSIEMAAKDHILAAGDLVGRVGMDPQSPEARQLPGDAHP